MAAGKCDVMIAGVGGQGTVLASRVLARAALGAGFDVKVSEVHGMAQRGGSVVSQIRFGREVHSPLIPEGEADYILAFERLEALRWCGHLSEGGTLFINDQIIEPAPVLMGLASYPEDIFTSIRAAGVRMRVIDALGLARDCGAPLTVNTVLLGLLSQYLPLEEECWLDSLRENIPEDYLEVNIRAFRTGQSFDC